MSDRTDDPMPVFPLLAKDDLAPRTVLTYATTCWSRGLRAQAREVQLALDEMQAWRSRHPDLCHLPDHEHTPTVPSADALRADELERVIRRVLERHTTLAREEPGGRGSLCEADEYELRAAIRMHTPIGEDQTGGHPE